MLEAAALVGVKGLGGGHELELILSAKAMKKPVFVESSAWRIT